MTADVKDLAPVIALQFEGLAEVLEVLIRLHDREVDLDFLRGAAEHQIAGWIGSELTDPEGKRAAAALGAAIDDLVAGPAPETFDLLAAEYADLFLSHGYRVSPSGSVWLTEDRLERQLPMFDVREWYTHYDIAVPDWRRRADDHLVHEFQFVAFLCRFGTVVGALDAARFLDVHVLPWVPEFCRQGLVHIRQPLYRASFELTLAVLEEVRDRLEEVTGLARATASAAAPDGDRATEKDMPYVPGLAESW